MHCKVFLSRVPHAKPHSVRSKQTSSSLFSPAVYNSSAKKSNISTMEEVHTKKKYIHTMMFTHIDVNFDIKYEGHQNWSKILSMCLTF